MTQQSTVFHCNENKYEKSENQGNESATLNLPDEPCTLGAPGSVTMKKEIGGPKGLEPTRFGDWEVNGRCSDF